LIILWRRKVERQVKIMAKNKVLQYLKIMLLLLFIAVFSAGCLRIDAEVDLNMDGSGNLQYDLGAGNMIYSLLQLDGALQEEIEAEARERNYSIEEYEEDDFSGFRLEKEFADLEELGEELALFLLFSSESLSDEIPADLEEAEDLPDDIAEEELVADIIAEQEERIDYKFEDGLFTRNFRIDYTLDLSQQDITLPPEVEMFVSGAFYEQFELGLTLNLPFEPVDHNATVLDAESNSLRWDFNYGEENEIFIEGRVLIWENIVIGVIALLILLVVLLFQLKARKKKKT